MDLSIIVPIYNEVEQLPGFFRMLDAQQGVAFELIVSDGGSNDGSVELVEDAARRSHRPIRLIRSGRGRARQLNAGAAAAAAATLLFLHVDSRFTDDFALRSALDCLHENILASGRESLAGHFRLKFSRSVDSSDFGFYFWESKARLDRPECTHGDQGFLLRASFWRDVGPFDTDAPIAEDTRLAERVRACGRWILLPAEIWTSARRFEVEGLRERQTLNALIMNFAAIGWREFFAAAGEVYRSQSAAARLDLVPFFDLVDRLNRTTSPGARLRRWYRTGTYVRGNAWQLAFLQDIKHNFAADVPVDQVRTPRLARHDAWFDRLTDNPLGRTIVMIGTWVWFRRIVRRYRHRRDDVPDRTLL